MLLRIHETNGVREVLVDGDAIIGRHRENDIVVRDGKVSTEHARIVRDRDQFFIEDLGSTNQTRIAHGPVLGKGDRHPLEPGVRFSVGLTFIDVLVDEDDDSEPATARVDDASQVIVMTRRPRLILIVDGRPRAELVSFDDGVRPGFIIGRNTKAHCVIPSADVSGLHARITLGNDRFVLEDLGSSNGTFLGEVRLEAKKPREVESGQMILFGRTPALFATDLDAEGKPHDAARYGQALDHLVHTEKISRKQRFETVQRARENRQNPGENLVLEGLITVADWATAYARGAP